MDETGSFSVDQVDVVVLDVEDIVRAAAANALQRFGFLANHVHEAESAEEALSKVTELQNSQVHVKRPVIVFLPQRFSGIFARRALVNEPFLVCTFSSARVVPTDGDGYFHYSMPKTFEVSKLSSCFEHCQQWWAAGAAAPGSKPIAAPISAAVTPVSPVLPVPAVERKQVEVIQQPADPNQQWLGAAPQWGEATSQRHAGAGYSGSTETGIPEDYQPPASRGNSLECLDSLLPPKPPYEDIQLLCLVGRGSFGRVYKARWGVSFVAVKVVEHYEEGSKTSVMQFEGALSASLAHPNLVQTFKHSIRETSSVTKSSNIRGCEVWIVQEWCGLGTLNEKIVSKSILSKGGFPEVADVATEIASAAVYLHERGIIHGDLTSSNVLLVEKNLPKGYTTKVSDFGLARVLDSGMSGIHTATMGTVTSMPPELFQLEGCSLTKKVDVYAFGVILWQLCSGTMPYEGLQPTQVVVIVAQGATLEMPDHVPEALRRLFNKCVARSPVERAGFLEIVRNLLEIVGEFNPEIFLLRTGDGK